MAMTAWAAKFVNQRDLLVGEGTNFISVQGKRSNQVILFEHWDSQIRSHAPEFDCGDVGRFAFGVILIRCEISNVRRLFRVYHAAPKPPGPHRSPAVGFGKGRRCVERGKKVKKLAIPAIDIAEFGVADANRVFQHGSEHRLQIRRESC